MSRRLYKRCLFWLLPLLVAQAVVPVGFMVAGGETGLQIEFCPVQSAQLVAVLGQQTQPKILASADHAGHHEHGAHHAIGAGDAGAGGSPPQHAQSNACPSALVATAIASSPAATIIAIELIQVEVHRAPEQRPPVEALRSAANRVRGPPHLLS
jgi:hypothetical protein